MSSQDRGNDAPTVELAVQGGISTSTPPAEVRTGADVIDIRSKQKVRVSVDHVESYTTNAPQLGSGTQAAMFPAASAGEAVQLAAGSADVHAVDQMIVLSRDALAVACASFEGLTMAWMSDDGREFVVTGNVSPYAGCKLAAAVGGKLRAQLGPRGNPIVGTFLPMEPAMQAGLAQVWMRLPR